MQPVLTTEESRTFDKHLIEEIGIPSAVLMENASRGAVEAMHDWLTTPYPLLGKEGEPEVVVFAGPGNNGGDGFAIARLLLERGIQPTVMLAGDPDKLTKDAKAQYDILSKLLDPEEIYTIESEADALELIDAPDIIIDALLGAGSKGELRGAIREAAQTIERLQEWHGSHVLAVDLPTGLDSDTGVLDTGGELPLIVRAERTVTMGAPKIGFYKGVSPKYTGVISIAHLGVPYPEELFQNDPRTYLLSSADVAPLIALFPFNANKYSRGRILALCGSRGMTGAAIMSATAALKSGAGWVTVAVPESQRAIVAQAAPELVTIGIAENSNGSPTPKAWNDIQNELEHCTAIVIGCGYQPFEETGAFVRKIAAEVHKPMVIDGGALRSIAVHLEILNSRKAPTILTPNSGELSALTGADREEVERDLFSFGRKVAIGHGVAVIAKGPREIIIGNDGTAYINSTGGPGLGTAGTGDVLSGLTATMLAQNPSNPANAAIISTYLCGLAGDFAAKEMTTRGMSATDIIRNLPEAFRALGVD